jgi:hypothetical protein
LDHPITISADEEVGIYAGGMLKESGYSLWDVPNEAATNSNGFTALPGSIRVFSFDDENELGYDGYWWTSTESPNDVTRA